MIVGRAKQLRRPIDNNVLVAWRPRLKITKPPVDTPFDNELIQAHALERRIKLSAADITLTILLEELVAVHFKLCANFGDGRGVVEVHRQPPIAGGAQMAYPDTAKSARLPDASGPQYHYRQ